MQKKGDFETIDFRSQTNKTKQFLETYGVIMTEEMKLVIDKLLRNSLFSSRMIINLVNDLLDMAKIENLTFNLNFSYFNLLDTIQDVIGNINFQAK
mmetsp:Transcript_26594/g.25675  ORF Transcript_26594/g.25675 Transcript_26594/m.25675 type:complete len:96 (-) Transcript_26594:51-338(-)